LALAYGSLVAVIVIGILLVALLPRVTAVQQYGPNVVADFAGLLVTLTFVERFLAYQRSRAETPLRTVALHRAWLRLNRLSHMLLFSYKASAPSGSPTPTELEALMEAWKTEACRLDMRKPAGGAYGNRPWYLFASETAVDFESELHEIIDRYLTVLGAEFPAAVESVIGDTVFEFLKRLPDMVAAHQSLGVDRPLNPFVITSVEDPAQNSLASFSDHVIAMNKAYRQMGGKPLTLTIGMYRDDIGPGWGSGRINE
jgi:hypothetical protein